MNRTVSGAVRAPLLGDCRRGQIAPGRTFDCLYGTGPGREGQHPAPCSPRGWGTGAARPDSRPREGGRARGGVLGRGRAGGEAVGQAEQASLPAVPGPPLPAGWRVRGGARPELAEGLSLSNRQVAWQGRQVWSWEDGCRPRSRAEPRSGKALGLAGVTE